MSGGSAAETYCQAGLTYKDRTMCAVGDLADNLLAQKGGTPLGIQASYDMPLGVPGITDPAARVPLVLDLQLFDDHWSNEYDRVQAVYAVNEWSVLPPGPPVGTRESFGFDFGSTFTSSVTSIISGGSLVVKIRFNTINPFNFDLSVDRFALKLAYDDPDGASLLGQSYNKRTIKTNPTSYGVMLSTDMKQDLTGFTLSPTEQRNTPYVSVPVTNTGENLVRLYDEYLTKSRFCLHAMDGLADVRLESPSPAAGEAPFKFSLPFSIPGGSMSGRCAFPC